MAAPIVDPARAAYIKEIRAYYADEYAKAFGLGNVENPKARAYLDVAATNPNIEAWSHRNRIIRNIQIMKHTFTAHKTDNISVCFKATYNGTSCIYAFLHGRCAAGSWPWHAGRWCSRASRTCSAAACRTRGCCSRPRPRVSRSPPRSASRHSKLICGAIDSGGVSSRPSPRPWRSACC